MMVMQLIFTLSEYDLKHEVDLKKDQEENPAVEIQQPRDRRRAERDSKKKGKDKGLTQVSF